MASEPSWGPCIGKWPPEMDWIRSHYWSLNDFRWVWDIWRQLFLTRQTKIKMFVQEIIHFIKNQNIHSNKYSLCLKMQNIPSKQLLIFSKNILVLILSRLKRLLPNVSNSSEIIQGSLVGPISVHFRESFTYTEASGGLQSHIWALFWNFE